uniref:Uncharacterized protein n=1 Tax=Romanomermis culicivorax TaxID=13658 RepID=A0A915HWK4_ROMCU
MLVLDGQLEKPYQHVNLAKQHERSLYNTFWPEYKQRFGPCLYQYKQFSERNLLLLLKRFVKTDIVK